MTIPLKRDKPSDGGHCGKTLRTHYWTRPYCRITASTTAVDSAGSVPFRFLSRNSTGPPAGEPANPEARYGRYTLPDFRLFL